MCRLQWDTQKTRKRLSAGKRGIKKHDLSIHTMQDESQAARCKNSQNLNEHEIFPKDPLIRGCTLCAGGTKLSCTNKSVELLNPQCFPPAARWRWHKSLHKTEVTQIWLYQFSGAHCHDRGCGSSGAGWVSRCEGVSTKAHLFSVCSTKQQKARWIAGPWGAPNSSIAWLLNASTMLCLKASEKWSVRSLSAVRVMNSSAAAAQTTSVPTSLSVCHAARLYYVEAENDDTATQEILIYWPARTVRPVVHYVTRVHTQNRRSNCSNTCHAEGTSVTRCFVF